MSNRKFSPNEWFKTSSGLSVTDDTIQQDIRTKKITIQTEAIPLPSTALNGRKFVRVMNIGDATIYIGGADVTSEHGWRILPNRNEYIPIEDNVTLYGISDSSVDVIVMEGL